ncbi:MAG: hypothetical protein GY906_22300 [bacterium]|nr:hypothetical protein [bacterium]
MESLHTWAKRHVDAAHAEAGQVDGMTEGGIPEEEIAAATQWEELVKLLERSHEREDRNCKIRWQLEDRVSDLEHQRDDATARGDRFLRWTLWQFGVIVLLLATVAAIVGWWR